MNEPLPLGRIHGGVHAAMRHDSAVGHVTGAARYLDDIPNVPGTLEAALVLSPHPHACLQRIDFSRALAAPGVVAAIAAADIPGKNDIAPIHGNEPALAADVVEYEGQPVAAVAAETLDAARAAAKLVDIEYEPLPAVLTVEGAMARGSFVSPLSTSCAARSSLRSSRRRIDCPENCAAAGRTISIWKDRSRSRSPARPARWPCGARPSIRPKSSTAWRICSGCPSTP
jgi:xanthine dehydrogenase molybdopterin-binding subunit B